MRYRALTKSGDYILGQGMITHVKDVDAVAQAIKTRLLLFQNEWWENLLEGLPWWEGIAGHIQSVDEKGAIDALFQERILGTRGVVGLNRYSSSFDTVKRKMNVNAVVDTIYGVAEVIL